MKHNIREYIATSGLLIVLILLMNPFGFYYSNMILACSLTLLILLYIFFAMVIMKEKPADEREEKHQYIASSIAFLVGTTLLIVGITIQSLLHTIDVWLIIALIGMIVAKLVTIWWSRRCC